MTGSPWTPAAVEARRAFIVRLAVVVCAACAAFLAVVGVWCLIVGRGAGWLILVLAATNAVNAVVLRLFEADE